MGWSVDDQRDLMALILVTSLFMVILLWVTWRYVRHRDPLLRDVIGMFASVAMLFVVGLLRLFVAEPPRVVMMVALALLLAKPVLTLRVVSRLRPLPAWWWPASVVGWVLTAVPVVASAQQPVPRPVIWPAVRVCWGPRPAGTAARHGSGCGVRPQAPPFPAPL
jgi:hypothetical protein